MPLPPACRMGAARQVHRAGAQRVQLDRLVDRRVEREGDEHHAATCASGLRHQFGFQRADLLGRAAGQRARREVAQPGRARAAQHRLHRRDVARGHRQFRHAEPGQQRRAEGLARQAAADADPSAVPRGRVHRLGDQPQHRRVQAVGLGRQLGVLPVDRQHVLRQVVGADGEEIHMPRQRVGLHRGGRHLDHDADRDFGRAELGADALAGGAQRASPRAPRSPWGT